MNVEMNTGNTPEKQPRKRDAAIGKKRKHSHSGQKRVRESVTYSATELLEVEAQPFWNSIHEAQVKSVNEEGFMATVAKNGETLEVFVPREECQSGDVFNAG